MFHYGRQIVNYFLEKWSKSSGLHPEYITRVQADSHRRDIRVFEIGLSSQRYGNNIESTRNASYQDGLRLIDIAKENNLFIQKTDWDKFGDRKRLPSGESIVYLSADGKTITKIRNPFAKASIKNLNSKDLIFEHLVHNILFPNTQYTFIGISEDIDGVRIIYTQPYISMKFVPPSQKQIDRYIIKGLGLKKQNSYFYGNDYISITDVSADSDNVLVDTNGQLFFIDPIIRFNKPALEVIAYYEQFLK
ncbi:MAG: hypothetical protein IKQ46_16190 [Bacteroidales bacterium]|nr:hypothetical protein [Bacteroidales bacterium]